jgi:hypothetical protein
VADDDMENYELSRRDEDEDTEYKIYENLDGRSTKYKIFNTNDAYKYNFARLKVWLTSFSRLEVFKLIDECGLENDVIRIHTDGIILPFPFDFAERFKGNKNKYLPIPEKKSTGLLKFLNSQTVLHVCPNCQYEESFKILKQHYEGLCPNCNLSII